MAAVIFFGFMMIFFRKYALIIFRVSILLSVFICPYDLLFAVNRTTAYSIDMLRDDYNGIDEPSGKLIILFIHSDDERIVGEIRKTIIPFLNSSIADFRSSFAIYLNKKVRRINYLRRGKNPDREAIQKIMNEINNRWSDSHKRVLATLKKKVDSTLLSLNKSSKDIKFKESLKNSIRIKKISAVGIFTLIDSDDNGKSTKSLIILITIIT